ncbi:helix-turn-helix transcriptional regulator [Planctomicrobium sp. SH664]|uniref:helix-turn-helix transcriptional regulator n=1 Tax=Planctomicrobium sp. SH664 TaxID=3448125 RepID=UPI003F5B03C3
MALTAADVARLLNVSIRHVAALNATGRLPRPIRLGRAVRWNAEELRAWLAAGAPSRDRWEILRANL